jgi:hypothetical protein
LETTLVVREARRGDAATVARLNEVVQALHYEAFPDRFNEPVGALVESAFRRMLEPIGANQPETKAWEGTVIGLVDDTAVLRVYNDKYDWNYTVDEYGAPTRVAPTSVLAWRSAGWAGRHGFQQTGRWRFTSPATAL